MYTDPNQPTNAGEEGRSGEDGEDVDVEEEVAGMEEEEGKEVADVMKKMKMRKAGVKKDPFFVFLWFYFGRRG